MYVRVWMYVCRDDTCMYIPYVCMCYVMSYIPRVVGTPPPIALIVVIYSGPD